MKEAFLMRGDGKETTLETGGSRAFWNREGEKTGFSPPLHVCPQRGFTQVCLIGIELTGEGISQIHVHKRSAVKTELKSWSVHVADSKLPLPKGPELPKT